MRDDAIHALVHAEIDRRRDEIVDFLAALVRLPSVNRPPHGDEWACQQFLARVFADHGLEVDLFEPSEIPGIESNPGWWPGADYRDRPNVVGTRHGHGGGRSLMLLGHADVVPEGPHELWRHGSFTPVVEDGALVGRGSADDKGGLAAQFMALACLESAGFRSRGDILLASVVDEESAGANGTLATLLRPHVADGCVYTDGLDLEVHVAQLGGVNFEIELQLDPDQAGPTIATMMEVLPRFYADLAEFGRQRSEEIAADPRYAQTAWPSYAFRMTLLQAGSLDGANPGGARVHASAYVLPGESIDAMRERIEDRVRASAERWKSLLRPPRIAWVGRMMPPSAMDPDHPFVDAVCRSYQQATGSPARRTGMPMSDLFQFLLHSPRPMPTVAMGPGRWGVPGGAHEPNESILIDEHLIPLTKTLASLMIDWCEVVPA